LLPTRSGSVRRLRLLLLRPALVHCQKGGGVGMQRVRAQFYIGALDTMHVCTP
jgi:hypothetical protein